MVSSKEQKKNKKKKKEEDVEATQVPTLTEEEAKEAKRKHRQLKMHKRRFKGNVNFSQRLSKVLSRHAGAEELYRKVKLRKDTRLLLGHVVQQSLNHVAENIGTKLINTDRSIPLELVRQEFNSLPGFPADLLQDAIAHADAQTA
jgi:hypothetical protein